MLVAGLKTGSRYDSIRQERESPVGILIEEEDVTVELPRATPPAAVAGEPYVPYDIDELLLGEPEEIGEFPLKGIDLFIKRARMRRPPIPMFRLSCAGTGLIGG